MRVLVVGGAGYIGSHAVRRLLKENCDLTVMDDLSHGHSAAIEAASVGLPKKADFVKASVLDKPKVCRVLTEKKIDAVMHFGAFIEVGESVADPGKYYMNNFYGSLSLLDAMKEAHVSKIVFSSTAAVYGNPATTPIQEDHPRNPINPYGRSKMMVEMALEDYASAYGLGYSILRYFNVAGANPDGLIGEAHEPESHLIPRILDVAAGKSKSVSIYGTDYPTPDGTCIRDYIHVEDLVAAHFLALHKIKPGAGAVYNLGSEKGFSVREVIQACEKVTGVSLPIQEQSRRAGDPPSLVASSSKIRQELGWKREFPDLQTIVQHAWNWHQNR